MRGEESCRVPEAAERAGSAQPEPQPQPAREARGSTRHSSTPEPMHHPENVAALTQAAASPNAASAAAAGRPVLADMTFRDSHLERLYEAYFRRSNRGIFVRFAFFRAALLLLMSFRAVAAGDLFGALLFVLMSAGSVVPVASAGSPPTDSAGSPPTQQASPLERRLRVGVILAVDVAQAAVGCRCMHHLAPFQEGWPSVAALAHLVHASGVLWTHFYSAFSPLTFRLLFMQQAAVCLVLMAGSGHICRYNAGLRMGYRTLQQLVGVALPGAPACQQQQQAQQAMAADVALCMQWQAPLLLLPGFLAATWASFRAERRLRLMFLGQLQEQHAAQQAQHGDAGAAGLGSGDEAHAVVTLPADVARLRAELVPSDLDFLANFAVPALGLLWTYGRWAL